MEFRLIYQGRLPAAGASNKRTKEKQAIRRAFHPQLRELWLKHPGLEGTRENRHTMDKHMAERYSRFGYRFIPLVCGHLGLICALDILFLRREGPGDAIHGGDLDNRLKVLFDGLRLPTAATELAGDPPTSDDVPFYCLLEDDRLISGFRVTTDRLLTPVRDKQDENDIALVIKVQTSSNRRVDLGRVE